MWKPIESCPKNVYVLVADGMSYCVVRFEPGTRKDGSTYELVHADGVSGYEFEVQEEWTYWMPLPPLPNSIDERNATDV